MQSSQHLDLSPVRPVLEFGLQNYNTFVSFEATKHVALCYNINRKKNK